VAYRVQEQQGVNTASLAAGAARAALEAAHADPAELEMIVVGTTSPDVLWPSTACLVQTELKLPMVAAFDLYAAEASLLTAIDVALRYVTGGSGSVLVIGSESDNQLVDLPGQGGRIKARAAAAAVLRGARDGVGVLSTVVGGAAPQQGNGRKGDDGLLDGVRRAVDEALRRAGLSLDDIDLVVGDQSEPAIMAAWSGAAGVPASRMLLDPDRYGALLSAAPLIALHDASVDGRLNDGTKVLLIECGAGPIWAAACLRWGGTGVRKW
jgi:3-oxoacyl-[acyl-carrier-protein] synthase-3